MLLHFVVFLKRHQANFKILHHFGKKIQQLNIIQNTRLQQVIRELKLNLTVVHHLLQALYNNESTAHRLLQADKAALEKDKEELTAQTDEFRTSMRHITQLSNFPVNKYCTTTNGSRSNRTHYLSLLRVHYKPNLFFD